MLRRTSYLVSEGTATWLGGTAGDDFRSDVRRFGHRDGGVPKGLLDSLLAGNLPQADLYASAAVLVNLVFERAGQNGVRALFDVGGSSAELLAYVQATLGGAQAALDARLREEVLRLAKP